MADKIHKTNAIRILDKSKIFYSLITYSVDETDLSAIHVASELGQDVNRVFKTLILKGDKSGYFVCIIPGADEVDLKKAAKCSGNKNAEMIPMKDLLSVTGYIRGGCSPIGMKKKFPSFIHNSALNYDYIYISAGVRGMQICMNPNDLIQLLNITPVELILDK